jgi:pyruvate formate lyase activating enzyme
MNAPIPSDRFEGPHVVPGRHFGPVADGRIECRVCPRLCKLNDGQRGLCFVRARRGDEIVLTTWGRSSGFCVDPIEKKPLAHFLPGTSVLSFGTAGCNLGCTFCQNHDISRARDTDRLSSLATPQAIVRAALAHQCRSVAFTYNDPVIFLEYAVDVARACRAAGLKTVAVTAGFITPAARADFFADIDAANVDLKAFTPDFYRDICKGRLDSVLDTLVWLKRETQVWTEITTLLIPGKNDGDEEIAALAAWIGRELGRDVPLHFSAFHPDHRMLDVPRTPPSTLARARQIARKAGLHHVYVGNVRDPGRQTTLCPTCTTPVISRDWHRLTGWHLRGNACGTCGTALAGHFETQPGPWRGGRQPVDMRRFA